MTINEIEREIQAMQLDRDWADEIRKTVQVVRSYPQVLFYGVDDAMRDCATYLGADMWRDTLQAMVNGLRDLKKPDDFAGDYGVQIYGIPEWDMTSFIIAEKYEDIFNKFHVNNNVPFAYRLADRQNLTVIVFEKISDLEVMEYAMHHRGRFASGISNGVFPGAESRNIADFNWGGASSNVNRLLWSRAPEQSVFGHPSSSADF